MLDRRIGIDGDARIAFMTRLQLQARHKGDARVAIYPYAAIQHMETKLDEPQA